MEQVAVNAPSQPATSTQSNIDAPSNDKGNQELISQDLQPQDEEIEFEPGFKYKKSQAAKDLKQLKQLRNNSYKEISEAKQIRDQVAQFVSYLKENPAEAMKKFGIDPDQFSYSYLEKQLKQASMTEEQRKLLEYERQLSEYKTKEQQLQEQYEAQVTQQEVSKIENDLETQCIQAIEKLALPKDPEVVAWMAHRLLVYLKNGIEVSMEDVAREVKDKFYNQTTSILEKLDDSEFKKIVLANETLKERIRGMLMQEVQKNPVSQNQTRKPIQQSQTKSIRSKSPLTPKEARAMIDKKFGQRRL